MIKFLISVSLFYTISINPIMASPCDTLVLNTTVTKTGCIDDSTGTIKLNVTGGIPPYSYNWSNGSTLKDLENLPVGEYKVIVADMIGCQIEHTIDVQRKELQVYVFKNMPKCHKGSDGSIDITVANGKSPYRYTWSNGKETEDLIEIKAGEYSVSIVDAAGCSKNETIKLPQPTPIELTAKIQNNSCVSNEVLASIDVDAKGGGNVYRYLWSTGASKKSIKDLGEGEYKLTVTDNFGCQAMGSYTVSAEELIVHEVNCEIIISEPPICNSSSNQLMAYSETAVKYLWTISSEENDWVIVGGNKSVLLNYLANNNGSEATIKLLVEDEKGCKSECEIRLSSCEEINNPTDPCKKDFDAVLESSYYKDGHLVQDIKIIQNEDARYDLSHLVVGVSCGEIKNAENSRNYLIEKVVNEPHSGLSGIKVDNISDLNNGESFQIKIETAISKYAFDDNSCQLFLSYKAGVCITQDTLTYDYSQLTNVVPTTERFLVSVFPNPAKGNIGFNIDQDGPVKISLFHLNGALAKSISCNNQCNSVEIDTEDLNNAIYIYKITARQHVVVGRVVVQR